ncbi:MAG: fibrobacter succinogenes major paralogous domain-containing protein [Erythrobacter sp.]
MRISTLLLCGLAAGTGALATPVPQGEAQAAPASPPPATTTIGQQVWLARNLAVTTFRNGDPIPRITDARAWASAGSAGRPATSAYENDDARVARDGLLYNYAAIRDPRGLCPPGFRVPTDADWNALETFLGKNVAATRMKTRSGWPMSENGPGNGSDDVGFGGLPAGFRTQRGDFFLGGRVAYFWSLTELSPTTTTAHMLFDYDPKIFRIAYDKAMGMSVRCLKA